MELGKVISQTILILQNQIQHREEFFGRKDRNKKDISLEPAKYTENVHSVKLKETLEQSNAVLRNFLFLVNNLTSPAMISDNS